MLFLYLICMIFSTSFVTCYYDNQAGINTAAKYRDPALKYKDTGSANHPLYSCMITLSKPGEGCDSHESYPNTIQCAETKRCISLTQFKDGKYDCCGPNVGDTCHDKSDENRVEPNPVACKNHSNYKNGTCFQCAIRRDICLNSLTQRGNAVCDCCPEVNGDCCHPNCTDHSDEECSPTDWNEKFTCDGMCKAVNKLNDSVADCTYHCVENNPIARQACEISRRERDQTNVDNQCNQLKKDKTANYKCPSGAQRCITLDKVQDGIPNCEHGEDENRDQHPRCTDQQKAQQCQPNSYECVAIDKGQHGQFFCRCQKGEPTCCNSKKA